MSSIGDLSISISADASQVTAGMNEVRNQLGSTTEVIHTQQTNWANFGLTIVGAMVNTVGPIISFINFSRSAAASTVGMSLANLITIPSTLTLAAAINACIWPLTLIVVTIAAVVAAYYLLAGSSEEAATATASASEQMTAAATQTDSYVASLRAAAVNNGDTIVQYSQLATGIEKFGSSLLDLHNTMTKPFIDGASAVAAYVMSFSPLPSLAGVAASALNGITTTVGNMKQAYVDAGEVFATVALRMQGYSAESAAEYIAEGRALEERNAEMEKSKAKTQDHGAAYKALGDTIRNATTAAANSAQVAGIGKMFDVSAIDASISALKEETVVKIASGTATEESTKQTNALLEAMIKQRQGVADGTIVDSAALAEKKRIADEQKKIDQDYAATTKKLTEEFEASKKSIGDKFDSMIQKNVDSIGLLDGSASKASISIREMSSQGFSDEQMDAIAKTGDMAANIKAAADEKKKAQEDADKLAESAATAKGPAANLKGSAGALSAIFAAGKQPLVERQVKIAEQTLTEALSQSRALAALAEAARKTGGETVVGGSVPK